jgi:hypothetical protein
VVPLVYFDASVSGLATQMATAIAISTGAAQVGAATLHYLLVPVSPAADGRLSLRE